MRGDGEAALGLMSDLFQWALSHGGSTAELRDTAYGNFLHDEAIEQEEAANTPLRIKDQAHYDSLKEDGAG